MDSRLIVVTEITQRMIDDCKNFIDFLKEKQKEVKKGEIIYIQSLISIYMEELTKHEAILSMVTKNRRTKNE